MLFVNQAAMQAIVVSTLLPTPGAAFIRWTDALIGGGGGAGGRDRRAAGAAAASARAGGGGRAQDLDAAARGCGEHRRRRRRALAARAGRRAVDRRAASSSSGRRPTRGCPCVRSSPFRRRHRGGVRAMAELVEPLDFALRNTRVLVRRVAVACYRRRAHPGVVRRAAGRPRRRAPTRSPPSSSAGRAATAVRDRLVELGRATSRVERSERPVRRGGARAGPLADRRPAGRHRHGPAGRDRPDPAAGDLAGGRAQSSRTTESTTATRSPPVRSATARWRW